MKHCQHCGANFDDTMYATCPYCADRPAEPTADGYSLPPIPTAPTRAIFNEAAPAATPTPPRRRGTPAFVWVLVGLAAAVLVGLVVWLVIPSSSSEEEKAATAPAETAASSAGTESPVSEEPSVKEEAAAATRIFDISGTMHLETAADGTTGSGASALRFTLSANSEGEVRGNVVRDGKDVGIAGFFFPQSGRLVLYDNSGDTGRYEGYVNGSTYEGKYYGVSGTWNFNLSVQ